MRQEPHKDANEIAAELLRQITHRSIAPKGDDLLSSDELKRQFQEAKDREARRQKGKN